MKLYIVSYINQSSSEAFNMNVILISQEVWAHSEEEVIGKLYKSKEPPQNMDKISMIEITKDMASKILEDKE